MTTLDDRLRLDLPRIAAAVETQPRPWPPPIKPKRSRRRVVVVGLAVVALAGGGVALADALIPDDVVTMHQQVNDYRGCGKVESDKTKLVASAARADGDKLELWVAPTTLGQVADTLRIVKSADGTWVESGGGCGAKQATSWAFASTETSDGQSMGIVDVRGHINEDVATAVVTFTSGATVKIDVQTDGYFLTSFRDDVAKYDNAVSVTAAD